MTMHILLVISDPLQRETVKNTIYDGWNDPGERIVIGEASNIAEARLKLDEPDTPDYDLLICKNHVASTSREPVLASGTLGLEFLQELDEKGIDISTILITFDETLFSKIQLLDNTGMVLEGKESMDEELLALTRKYLNRKRKNLKRDEDHEAEEVPSTTQAKTGKIDIRLKPAPEFSYYTMEGTGFRYKTSPIPIQLDMQEIDELIHRYVA
jgi:DNA-binding NarL/FixJ family response regulator